MYEAVSGNGLLPDWHQAISPVSEPMLTYWFCCCYGPVLYISWIVQIKICIMYFLNWANKDMFKLNLKYPIIWLICLLRYIKFELNWIGIERKWIQLELNWKILNSIWIGIELNWKILNPTWIGIELNWKKWIDPSPDHKVVIPGHWQVEYVGRIVQGIEVLIWRQDWAQGRFGAGCLVAISGSRHGLVSLGIGCSWHSSSWQ